MQEKTEESTPGTEPHPPRFNKLTRTTSDSVSESYVKSLLKFADYIYEINYSKDSKLQTIDTDFSSNSKLYSVTFPPSLITIKPESMKGLRYLYEILFLKNDDGENFLETIGCNALQNTNLESITIPSNIVNIEGSFPKCLKAIELENGAPKLQNLGDFTFSRTQIESFKMPINILPLLNSKSPFLRCQKLSKIIFDSYIDTKEPPAIDYESEEHEKEDVKKRKQKIKEKGQNLTFLTKSDSYQNFEEEENKEGISLDFAKHYTLSQIPNLESIEVFSTNLNNFYFLNTPNLTSIQIAQSDKGRYIKDKGCLYTKDKKSLIVAERNIKNATIFAECQLISNYALNVKSLEKVTFEKNSELQEISMFAFAESNIKELAIPDSVDLINQGAFYKCKNLETVNIPTSLNVIDYATFSYTNLAKIKIPSNVVSIEHGSFYKCFNLSEVEFENDSKLTKIGDYAFAETKIEAITIPKNVKKIGDFCFINCERLKQVNFEEKSNLNSIGRECFKGTKIDEIHLPREISSFDFSDTEVKIVTFSDESLFRCMQNLHHTLITQICIPSNVKTIEKHAFLECTQLEKVTFTDVSKSNLKSIEKEAFLNCSSLTEFEMPKRVKYFGVNCFKNCSKLAMQVNIEHDNITVCQNAFDNCGILVFQSKGQNITINSSAFNNCTNLTKFTADATKSCILGSTSSKSLFLNCTSLTDVKLNFKAEKVQIGYSCFENSAIKAFEIPKQLNFIPQCCFKNCQNLSKVTINKGLEVEIFYHEAFSGSGIESIIFPPKTEFIEEKCFKDCAQLKKVSFSKDLENCRISDKAFYNSGIEQLTIHKNVKEIGNSCFKNCQNLVKLSFAADTEIKNISTHSFQSTGIKSLVLPSSISFIEKSAFRDCKQLESVTFNSEKVHISRLAFAGCDSLKSIKCKDQIIVEAAKDPKVFDEFPVYVYLTQKDIDETIIKLFLVNYLPLYTSYQRYDIENSLLFNIDSRITLPVECHLYEDSVSTLSKYQIIEYKDGGYYSNLMKNLLFCDFSRKELIVPKDTEIIESKAFKHSNLNRIEFEENSLLHEIKSFAFEFLKIEQIEIPDSVTFIGDSAFSDCHSLKKVIISQTSNLTTIGQNAFSKTAIKYIVFPATLRTISDCAFYECYNLTNVENYSNEITFGYASFYRSSIEKIDFPEKSVFDDFSFSNCKNLKKLLFVGNKEKIVFGEDSFSFSGLEEIVIKCDAEIKTKAFSFCSNLKKLTLEGNIECYQSSFACSNLENCEINLTQKISKIPSIPVNDILLSNIDNCSIKLNTSDKTKFNMKHKCYVLNNTIIYADQIDNFSLTTPYNSESNRRPIKRNEILRVPSCVTKLDFDMMSHIRMIIFPSNCLVNDLGPPRSFSYYNLIEITIPKLVQQIPASCFQHCHFLRTLKFEEGSTLKEIGNYAFSNTRIRKLILPSSVQIIRENAFSNNLDLKEAYFDGEIIEDEAFSQTGLKSFTLSNNTKKIGSKAFQYCYNLSSFSIDIENSELSEIGSYAFLRTAITTINIPANVKFIEPFTFEDCQFLTEINVSLNSKLEQVNKFAFSGSTRFTKMTIPRSISNLFEKFIESPSLHSILFSDNYKYCLIENKENPEILSLTYNFSEENTHNCLVNNSYVVDDELVYADLTDNAGLFEPATQKELDDLMKRNEILYVPKNVKKLNFPMMPHVKRVLWSSANIVNDIGPSGFFSYYNLIQITIPKSVQIIPPRAFEHCHFLTILVFESRSKLKEIGEYSFSNTKIKSVVIPSSVKIIKKGAFSNNPDLSEVSFSGEIIEDEAFSRTGITSFILSNKTKSIGARAFEYCSLLTAFSINLDYSSLSEIGSYAFSESSITSINIPPNVKTIKSFTFSGCRNLKTVNISSSSSLEEIKEYSFVENLSLVMINIPKTIKKLSYEAFINTPSLQSIMTESNDYFNVLGDFSVYGSDRTLVFVPRFLKKFKVIENCLIIHSGAFCGPNLEEIIFMDNSLMCIEKNAFSHSSGLKMITIPKSIQYIGEEAFIHCEKLEFVQFDQESQILEIPKFCFAFSGLKAITLPNAVKYINQSAFYFCDKMFGVTLENTSISYIGDYAFSVTNIDEIKLPSTIKYIGSHAFESIKSLKVIDLTNISDVDVTTPNQIKEFSKMLFIEQKKILKFILNQIRQHTLTENDINARNESIRNEMPPVIPEQISPPSQDEKQTNKSPRRKPKFSGPNIEIKSSPYLMLKNVPKVFKPNPYINKKVSKINPPFDNRAPVQSNGGFGKKNAAFPPPPPVPQKEGHSPRRMNKNKQNTKVEYQSILPPEAYEEEYSQDLTESTENETENNQNGPKSPKCYIHETAFNNSIVKTIRCNFKELEFYSFFENCGKIGKFIVNSDIRFRLKKLGKENSTVNTILGESLFRVSKLQYLNHETVPILSNQLITDFFVSKSVKFLKPYTFSYCSKLTKVSFDNEIGIKMIPEFCFAYSSLKEISIPSSVKSINKCAFLSCTSLGKVNFTRGNNLTSIRKGAFCECSSLTSIHISKSVEKIGKYAFYSCTNLQKVSFSDGSKLKLIDTAAFCKCSNLSSIKLPNKMKVIGKECFSYTGLKSIQIPQLVTKINEKTFYHCEELNKVLLNESIEEIGEFSFGYNKSLRTIELPSSLRKINKYAFSECRNLKKVKINDNTELVEVDEGSFEYTQIEELKVKSTCHKLFSPHEVNKLTKIIFEGGPPTFFIQTKDGCIYEKTNKFGDKFEGPSDIDDLESQLYTDLTNDFAKSIYYYCDKLNRYSSSYNIRYMYGIDERATDQKAKYILIERNRYSPGVDKDRPLLNLVFAPKNLEYLTIHEDCFSMNDSIFDGMNNLTTIEYKKGITNMINGLSNYNHFSTDMLSKLTEIKINGQYCHLSSGVFSNMINIERIEINSISNITYIPSRCFEGCINLREIILPSTIFSIESKAFKNCINLRSFLIKRPETNSDDQKQKLKFIRKEAFFNCSALTSVTLPSSVYAICEGAFMNCMNLVNFEIETNKSSETDESNETELEIIEKNCFKNCKVLSSFHLPNSIKYVGPGAFMNCISMKEFEYKGSSLQSIESRTFYNCKSLSKIEFLNLSFNDSYIPIPDFEPKENNDDESESSSKEESNSEEESKKEEQKHEENNEEKQKQEEEKNKDDQNHEEESKKEDNNEKENKNEEHNEEESKKEENHEEESKKEENKEEAKEEENKEEAKEEESKKEENHEEESKKVEDQNSKYKKLSKSAFRIGTEAFKNCVSLKQVIIEDESKNISTINFDSNDEPVYRYPPHIKKQIRNIWMPYCVTKRQTIQKGAFSNCRSLTIARFFLGNLESIQQSAFENCFSLTTMEVNSQFWRHLFSEALDFTSFIGTPDNLSIKIFNKNKYSCLMIDLSNHPKNPKFYGKRSRMSMAKSLPKNALLSNSYKFRNDPKNKTFEMQQNPNKTITENDQVKNVIFMESISLHLEKTEKEEIRDLSLYFSPYKVKNSRWDVFESVPFLCSQPLKDIDEMTYLLHAINFPSFYELTEITFGDDIEIDRIPDFCFSYTNLREILVPSSVEYIGKYAFYSCPNLQKVSFYSDSKLKLIDECAFSRCKNLSAVYLPYQLEVIGKECFSYTGLKFIQIPQLVKRINEKTFYHCEELNKVLLNESIEEIGEFSFGYNKSLRTIELPSSLRKINKYAFSECRYLRKVKINDNTELVEVDEGSFEHTQIEELKVKSTCHKLFSPHEVNKLTKIIFEGGPPTFFIQTKDGCIYEKTNKFDELLSQVKSTKFEPYHIYQDIQDDFDKTERGKIVDFTKESEENLLRRNRLRFSKAGDVTKPLLNLVFAPKDLKCLRIHEDCFSMNDSIFDGMNSLTTIEYKKGITNMINGLSNYNHFSTDMLSKLTEIKINGQYCHLSSGVFSNMINIERIEISSISNITYIPSRCFEGCINLREIILPSTIFSIESKAFKNCINLKTFLIRTKDKEFNEIRPILRFIRKEAFYNCSALTSVTLPSSVYAICEGAFMNCMNLVNFEIETNKTNETDESKESNETEETELEIIEKNCFKNCKVLSSFRLPNSIKYVGSGAFMNCISMKEFEYKGSSLQSIESRTFYNCKSLTIFKMKNLSYKNNYFSKKDTEHVENNDSENKTRQFSIGPQAFMNCTSLKKVIFEDKSKTIKTFEFGLNNSPRILNPDHDYTSCRSFIYPRSQLIQRKAFCNCKSLLFVRFFLGNLERIQTNAFKNCYLLKSIDLNTQYAHFLLNEGFDMSSFDGTQDDIEFKLYNMNVYIKSFFNLSQRNEQNEEEKHEEDEKENENASNNEKETKIVSQKRHFKQYLSSLEKTKYIISQDDNDDNNFVTIKTGRRHFKQFLSSLDKTRHLFQFDLDDKKRRHRKRRRQNKEKLPEISYNDLIWAATSTLPEWINKIVILNPVASIRIFKKYVSSFKKTNINFSIDCPVYLDSFIVRRRHFRHHLMTTSEILQLEEEEALDSYDEQNDSPDLLDNNENGIQNNDLKSKTI